MRTAFFRRLALNGQNCSNPDSKYSNDAVDNRYIEFIIRLKLRLPDYVDPGEIRQRCSLKEKDGKRENT